MSDLDVHRIICPHRDRELEDLRRHRAQVERVVISLRRKLIAVDPSLPNEYDGSAWSVVEGTPSEKEKET